MLAVPVVPTAWLAVSPAPGALQEELLRADGRTQGEEGSAGPNQHSFRKSHQVSAEAAAALLSPAWNDGLCKNLTSAIPQNHLRDSWDELWLASEAEAAHHWLCPSAHCSTQHPRGASPAPGLQAARAPTPQGLSSAGTSPRLWCCVSERQLSCPGMLLLAASPTPLPEAPLASH